MNVGGSYVTVMLIAGALSGLAGVGAGPRRQQRGDHRRRRRQHRLRRDHRRAAGPGEPGRHRVRRDPVRRAAGGRRCGCRPRLYADRDRAGHPVGDRAVHRRARADPGDLPVADVGRRRRRPGWRRGGTDDRAGVGPPTRNWSSSGTSSMSGYRCARGSSPVARSSWPGLICIFAWGLGANPGDADFGLRTGSDAIELPDIAIPAAPTAIALGLIVVALGAWHARAGVLPAADAVGDHGGAAVLRGGVPVLGEHGQPGQPAQRPGPAAEHDPAGHARSCWGRWRGSCASAPA